MLLARCRAFPNRFTFHRNNLRFLRARASRSVPYSHVVEPISASLPFTKSPARKIGFAVPILLSRFEAIPGPWLNKTKRLQSEEIGFVPKNEPKLRYGAVIPV